MTTARRSSRRRSPRRPTTPSREGAASPEAKCDDSNDDESIDRREPRRGGGVTSIGAPPRDCMLAKAPPPQSPRPTTRGLLGITRSGARFAVPAQDNTLGMLARVWEVPTVLAWLCFAVTAATVALSVPRMPALQAAWALLPSAGFRAPRWAVVYLAVFWRLMYNLVLGLVLRAQSRTSVLTRWMDARTEDFKRAEEDGRQPQLSTRVVNHLLATSLRSAKPLVEYPSELSAWVIARYFVNIILANDVVAFVAVILVHGDGQLNLQCDSTLASEFADGHSWCQVVNGVAWMVGTALIVASLWSKALSHGVVGTFAWFWGDMFFLAEQSLTFDGIFEIVPHPMYTVGYGWMYGAAILSGSWVVLALALGSHLCQLAFLTLVETPHIERLYGKEFAEDSPEWKALHTGDNIMVFKNFDVFRASDWSLLLVIVLLGVVAFAGPAEAPVVSTANIVLWTVAVRLLGTFVIGFVLAKQDRNRFWTLHYRKSGLDAQQAFDEWKRLYNLVSTVMSLSFVICAFRLRVADFSVDALVTPRGITLSLGAIILIGLSAWALMESHAALGDYGWFYGDFFVKTKTTMSLVLTEKGIYRFLSNPEAVLGQLWMYGLSLLVGSVQAGLLAALCHVIHSVFVLTIEEPHKHRLYNRELRRAAAAASKES